jgi:hypothetical protein
MFVVLGMEQAMASGRCVCCVRVPFAVGQSGRQRYVCKTERCMDGLMLKQLYDSGNIDVQQHISGRLIQCVSDARYREHVQYYAERRQHHCAEEQVIVARHFHLAVD